MILLTRDRAVFGGHQTFPFRFGWLTKGRQAWPGDHGLSARDEVTVKFGVDS